LGDGRRPGLARASARISQGVGRVWELQLFAPFGWFQPPKKLQPSLIPLNFVRPVTPKVAGSSPVAPVRRRAVLVVAKGQRPHLRRTERARRAHLYDPPDDYALHSAQRV
jgi:hypothetical protein